MAPSPVHGGAVPARVKGAKLGLQNRGHRVFYGLDIRSAMDADWRKQWCLECQRLDACVNFISDSYLHSQSCADEWNFVNKNKPATQITERCGFSNITCSQVS